MKATSCKVWITLLALTAVTLGGFTSCYKEDWSKCPDNIPSIKVVAAAQPGIDIDPTDIKSVTLYVFDPNGLYLGEHLAASGEVVMLNYPRAGQLHVTAIANAGSEGQEWVPTFGEDNATHISHGYVKLINKTRATNTLCHSPSDLFWGEVEVTNDGETEEERDIPVQRIVSSMNIKAVNLKDYAGVNDHNFHYEINSKYDQVNFYGQPSGSPVCYKPSNCQVTSGNVFTSPTFNMISSNAGQPVSVEIYYDGDQLIDTISKDSDGNPLQAVNGKLLNVHIDYTGRSIGDGYLSVTVKYSGWGDPLDIGKEIQ